MTIDYFNAASAASQFVGSLEGTRNFHWHNGNLAEAIRINKVLIETLRIYSWSRSSERWLEQYQNDQLELIAKFNESISIKADS